MIDVIMKESNGLNTNDLVFAKVKPNAIIPSKEDENAGYDIYACFNDGEDEMVIKPQETKLVPTGIASAMCDKYYLQVEERGSTGSKGIKKSAGVIDSGYRGEIFIAITNSTYRTLVITKNVDTTYPSSYIVYPYNKAIAQLVVHRVERMNVVEMEYKDLLQIPSNRKCGKLGESGK